jgi:putative heme-binding domain-containing protein
MVRGRTLLLLTVVVLAVCLIPALRWGLRKVRRASSEPVTGPRWIWISQGPKPGQTVYFRKEFVVDRFVYGAKLTGACDDRMVVYLNGARVGEGTSSETPTAIDVRDRLEVGRNVLAVEATNSAGPAGLLLWLALEEDSRPIAPVVTDTSWRTAQSAPQDWQKPDFDDARWTKARDVAALGGVPWNRITRKSLLAALKQREQPVTPISQVKVAKGFKVDLLYSVPKDEQGSWVSMALDAKGRLIVSDQYGKLYRIVLPPAGATMPAPTVEPIDLAIGEAQGLLWAFNALYAVVNSGGKYPSGLYRIRDRDGDDRLDTVELLRRLDGAGEHGPHAVLLGPDGNSLYVLAGNGTKLTELAGSLVPRAWGEDQLLPPMLDGNGFMPDARAPDGCVYRVDPEGKRWELVCGGLRNAYDAAFNRQGDLFTCDSDMEWDLNTPWYRPSRVCLVASGGELGFRTGTGVWPPDFPDSLPAAVNIGLGSPTGATFGTGASFPARYQEALFVGDWSLGKLYAIHLTPDQSAYTGEIEEFITGTPLPVTDIVVNPRDGAMYFAVGGRRTKSGLFRVTYVGGESTALPPPALDDSASAARAIRHKLERFHGAQDPAAVATAWPYLGHPDRFIRFAARVAIEWQDVPLWQERALTETDIPTALTALLALVRLGNASLQPRLIEALERIDWAKLTPVQRCDLLRIYALTFIRMGAPDRGAADRTIARLGCYYPSADRFLNAELCRLLVYLQAPEAAAKTIAMLEEAPTQEEQLEYVLYLRVLKTGWTMKLREAYFTWFQKAAGYQGGASFEPILQHLKGEALTTLSASEKEALKSVLANRSDPGSQAASAPSRPFVKAWKVDDLAPALTTGLNQRRFERGHALFSTAGCFACHRYNNEGGAVGPDLTTIGGRFSPRDLLESIILPSKEISDQYAAFDIALDDGRIVRGRVVNLFGDTLHILPDMHNPKGAVFVNRSQVVDMKPSPVSMMPAGLLDTLGQDEILDLLAYLLSRGQPDDPMF